MRENICERCGIEFGRRDVLIKHLKRKTICMPIEMDVDRNIQLDRLSRKCEIECERCNKMYKNSNSLRMHKCIEKENIMNDELEKMNDRLDRLEEENKMLKNKLEKGDKKTINSIKNITNNTDNSTNNITIVLPNSFGKENIDYLLKNPEKEIIKLLRGYYPENIVNFVKEVHKNPEHPENQNIKIENKKEGIISIFENNKWNDHTKTTGLQRIYDNTELKVLEVLDGSDESVIKKYVKSKQIERFNEATDMIGWADMIDIREEELDEKRVKLVKEIEEIDEKKRIKRDLDNLMIHTMSKKEVEKIC